MKPGRKKDKDKPLAQVGYGGKKPKHKTSLTDYGKLEKSYKLRLYVAGSNLNSITAIRNLEDFCLDYLQDKVEIEVVDLYQQPQLAREDQVVAVPCLVRLRPLPKVHHVGRLQDCRTMLLKLGIDPGKLKH